VWKVGVESARQFNQKSIGHRSAKSLVNWIWTIQLQQSREKVATSTLGLSGFHIPQTLSVVASAGFNASKIQRITCWFQYISSSSRLVVHSLIVSSSSYFNLQHNIKQIKIITVEYKNIPEGCQRSKCLSCYIIILLALEALRLCAI